jgi:hypothetical protein
MLLCSPWHPVGAGLSGVDDVYSVFGNSVDGREPLMRRRIRIQPGPRIPIPCPRGVRPAPRAQKPVWRVRVRQQRHMWKRRVSQRYGRGVCLFSSAVSQRGNRVVGGNQKGTTFMISARVHGLSFILHGVIPHSQGRGWRSEVATGSVEFYRLRHPDRHVKNHRSEIGKTQISCGRGWRPGLRICADLRPARRVHRQQLFKMNCDKGKSVLHCLT